MPKEFIKRYLPDHNEVKDHRYLRFFGTLLHSPDLWHLNRRSVSGAFAVGLFLAWVPVPLQMVLATATAILLRVNLPVAFGLVWITNPFTIPPLYYFAYLVGTWVLGSPTQISEFQVSWSWLESVLPQIWKPFLLGCLINGVSSAILGYYGIHFFWIWHVRDRWKRRSGSSN